MSPFVCGITLITHWLILFTRLVFIVMFLLNFFLLVAGSSGAVPFCKSSNRVGNLPAYSVFTFTSHYALDRRPLVWYFCSAIFDRIIHWVKARGTCIACLMQLKFIWFQGVSHPVRVNQIPRQIPPAPRHLRPWVSLGQQCTPHFQPCCRPPLYSQGSCHLVRYGS